MSFLYIFDEFTDVESEKTTRKLGEILMDGLRNPHKPRPENESPLGEIARQYVLRLTFSDMLTSKC